MFVEDAGDYAGRRLVLIGQLEQRLHEACAAGDERRRSRPSHSAARSTEHRGGSIARLSKPALRQAFRAQRRSSLEGPWQLDSSPGARLVIASDGRLAALREETSVAQPCKSAGKGSTEPFGLRGGGPKGL
jgi:hypothetical protein